MNKCEISICLLTGIIICIEELYPYLKPILNNYAKNK